MKKTKSEIKQGKKINEKNKVRNQTGKKDKGKKTKSKKTDRTQGKAKIFRVLFPVCEKKTKSKTLCVVYLDLVFLAVFYFTRKKKMQKKRGEKRHQKYSWGGTPPPSKPLSRKRLMLHREKKKKGKMKDFRYSVCFSLCVKMENKCKKMEK
jgi:hypothetical protein